MKCPQCGHDDDRVLDTRALREGASIRRRRECLKCEYRFTTYEEIEREELKVVKRDGRFEPFDKRKLISGIARACEKRPVSPGRIEQLVDSIIDALEKEHGLEIPTPALGEKVMDSLREVDEVAYVRFASVYRSFRDVNEFVSEIKNLRD